MSYIVTVTDPAAGVYAEWRGCRDRVVAMTDLGVREMQEGHMETRDMMRAYKMWSCKKEDIAQVVDKLSEQWVGYEVKVFALSEVHTRLVGEIKSKEVSKDGVFPK